VENGGIEKAFYLAASAVLSKHQDLGKHLRGTFAEIYLAAKTKTCLNHAILRQCKENIAATMP
jgi:hypothetical protein